MGAEVVRRSLIAAAVLSLLFGLAPLRPATVRTPLFIDSNSAGNDSIAIRGDSVLFGRLADGVEYRRIRRSTGAVVHLLIVDLSRGAHIDAVKADDRNDATEPLSSIYDQQKRISRIRGDTLLAAINAGTWDPFKLAPVGPLVVDGEVVEMTSDDEWSAFTLHSDGRGGIARDRMSGELLWRRHRVPILEVNRRSCEGCAVLYNRFHYRSVPEPDLRPESLLLERAIKALPLDAGIDGMDAVDTAALAMRVHTLLARNASERSATKMTLRRLHQPQSGWYGAPRVNDTVWTLVTGIDTGVVEIPDNGYVLSPGTAYESLAPMRVGDTVRLFFQLARLEDNPLHDAVPGYPQLLHAGAAVSEPEPAQGPAAMQRPYERGARTAVGLTASRDTILLAVVEPPVNGSGGMSIDELASLMLELGARDALALDGLASSTMIVNDEVVSHERPDAEPARVVGALAVVKRRR